MRLIALAWFLVVGSTAQGQSIDEGTFSIRKSGREIGREDFVIQPGRQGIPSGSTIISRTRIPTLNPVHVQEVVVERRADGSFANMLLSYTTEGTSGRVIAEIARNVLRIHTASGGNEGIRELPAPEHMVGLADSAFALFALIADRASQEGSVITGVYPRSGRRISFSASREGNPQEETRIVLAGEIAGTIWLDPKGHLMRMVLPGSDLEVVRIRR